MTERRPLTNSQRRVLDALQRHLAEHGSLPTAAELTAATGHRLEASVRYQFGRLVELGYLRRDDSQPGGLRFVQVEP